MAVLRYEQFFGNGVTAFTSDGSLDFLKGDPSVLPRFGMTALQRALLDTMGVKDAVIFPKQVHGDSVWEVTAENIDQAGVYEADAVVTATPGLAVAVRTPDCLPLLLFARESGIGSLTRSRTETKDELNGLQPTRIH